MWMHVGNKSDFNISLHKKEVAEGNTKPAHTFEVNQTDKIQFQVPEKMSNSSDLNSYPHVALLPSAGMGHLTPFLRLAASLVYHNCGVTLITSNTTISLSESQLISRFLSAFPQVTQKQFHILPLDPASVNSDDPFFLQWEAIRRSAQLLTPILSSMFPPLSALVTDVSLISSVIPVSTNLDLPNYVLFTSSARMCYLFESFPNLVASKTSSSSVQFHDHDVLEIPGLSSIPKSSIPPAVLDLNSLFAKMFLQNGQNFKKSNGILINTFEALESEIFPGVSDKRIVDGQPPFYPVGPLLPCEFEKKDCSAPVNWLDDQAEGSVVYVSFGSRYALSSEQMKELGNGLVRSGCRFLWVLKGKKVDKEDEESFDKLLGPELMEKIENHGLVVRDWVDQDRILGHRAVGGFVTHGGWNSLVEAAWHGVRVLVWPQFGDQKINAEVVEKSGLGMWVKTWGWGVQKVVQEEDISESIKDLMGNDLLGVQAKKIREEARKAVRADGSSKKTLNELIEEWKSNIRTI